MGNKINPNHEFWITNISNRNVCLADLAFTIHKGRSYNLLDSKHFYYTLEQLEKSAKEGSLFKKSNMIKIRNVPPKNIINPGIHIIRTAQETRPKNIRSQVKIVDKEYEELMISDEKFSEQFLDINESFLSSKDKNKN